MVSFTASSSSYSSFSPSQIPQSCKTIEINAQSLLTLLSILSSENDSQVSFSNLFTCSPSPNSPANTTLAAKIIVDYLRSHSITPKSSPPSPAPQTSSPNSQATQALARDSFSTATSTSSPSATPPAGHTIPGLAISRRR